MIAIGSACNIGEGGTRPRLGVLVSSTRPGRLGPVVADWFVKRVHQQGVFDVDLIDLATVNLPFLDEPNHPRLQRYTHEHTRQWSERVMNLDAFVFVVPEYNFGMAPTLLNALNFLFREWAYAPLGFVSYGGVSGGTRGVQMAKQVVTTLKMMPIPESVTISFVQNCLDADGDLAPTTAMAQAAEMMLDELRRWESALRRLRQRNREPGSEGA